MALHRFLSDSYSRLSQVEVCRYAWNNCAASCILPISAIFVVKDSEAESLGRGDKACTIIKYACFSRGGTLRSRDGWHARRAFVALKGMGNTKDDNYNIIRLSEIVSAGLCWPPCPNFRVRS